MDVTSTFFTRRYRNLLFNASFVNSLNLTEFHNFCLNGTQCSTVHAVAPDRRCRFILDTTDCMEGDGSLHYLEFLYCDFPSSYQPFGVFLCVLWLFMLFITLGTTADDFFCPSLTVIAKVLRLSQNVAGVTVLAFGNGAPDIFTSIVGAPRGRSELIFGEIFGAGIFVTTVIAGSICITSPFKLMERPFLRDVIFYLGAAYWTYYAFHKGYLTTLESTGFIVLYVVYIAVVLIGRYLNKCFSQSANRVPTRAYSPPRQTAEANVEAAVTYPVTSPVTSPRRKISSRLPELALYVEHERELAMSLSHHEDVNIPNNGLASSQNSLHHSSEFGGSREPLLGGRQPVSFVRDFFHELKPLDSEFWPEMPWYTKILEIIKVPVVLLLKLLIPVVDYTAPQDNWCRPLNTLHCITTPVFTIIAFRCASVEIGNGLRLWEVIVPLGGFVALFVLLMSRPDTPPPFHAVFAFLGFLGSVVLIYLVASEIVGLLKAAGVLFNLSDAVLGLTVLAWGNSIGDLIADLAITKQGYPRMGFSACFGGPLFNTLLGVGISFTNTAIQNGGTVQVDYGRAGPILAIALCASLVSSLIAFPLMKFYARRSYGIYLLVLYSIFVLTAVLTEVGVLGSTA